MRVLTLEETIKVWGEYNQFYGDLTKRSTFCWFCNKEPILVSTSIKVLGLLNPISLHFFCSEHCLNCSILQNNYYTTNFNK